METTTSQNRVSIIELAGLCFLAAFVFSIPTIYLIGDQAERWGRICQVLAILAIVTNLRQFNLTRLSLPMIALGGLWLLFAFTAFSTKDPDARDSFIVWSKFVPLSILLSLVVSNREQLFAVFCGLALSAIAVAYSSYDSLVDTQNALGRAELMSGRAELARTAGAFSNSNIMGMYAVDAILAGVALCFTQRTWLILVPSVGSIACAAYLAMFSGSRKAVLGVGCIVVFLVFMAIRRRKASRLPTKVALLFFAVVGVAWLIANPYLIRFDMAEESYQVRTGLLQESWKYVHDSPIFGLGYHGFQNVSLSGLYTHSTPIEILCNGGLFGAALYGLLWLGLCKSLYSCLAFEIGEAAKVLTYCIACYLTIQTIGTVASVVIEEPRYLVLTACVSGYLRSRELELRTRVHTARAPTIRSSLGTRERSFASIPLHKSS